jgi:hypothetical protein
MGLFSSTLDCIAFGMVALASAITNMTFASLQKDQSGWNQVFLSNSRKRVSLITSCTTILE